MIIPVPVSLRVQELSSQFDMTVEDSDQQVNLGIETSVNPTVIPQFDEMMERIATIEGKEPTWDSKYGETNPPPYPVTSVDSRLGDVELDDLYDTDAITLAEIAELFD